MARPPKCAVHGWLVLDKPLGLTSTQAIGRIRRVLNPERIGHAGTLDPLATGILPIALGEATKTVPLVQDGEKTYRFTVTWGEARATDDAEGEVIATSAVRPTPEAIQAALPRFLGRIQQLPPRYSAIKVEGARAYDLARAGETVELSPREVEVRRFELIEASETSASFEADTGKGCYVRSLARDLAEALGTVGYVSVLRRTRVGRFGLDRAISLDFPDETDQKTRLLEQLLPIATALDDIPALALTAAEAQRLRHGQTIGLFSTQDRERLQALCHPPGSEEAILALFQGQPVALGRLEGAEFRPVRVFNL